MSRHIVEEDEKRFVFGWDQPLSSFFLQVHDLTRHDEKRIRFVAGADADTVLNHVDALCGVALKEGLVISYETEIELLKDQDYGR